MVVVTKAGMSRASKKRAKKKQKNSTHQPLDGLVEDEPQTKSKQQPAENKIVRRETEPSLSKKQRNSKQKKRSRPAQEAEEEDAEEEQDFDYDDSDSESEHDTQVPMSNSDTKVAHGTNEPRASASFAPASSSLMRKTSKKSKTPTVLLAEQQTRPPKNIVSLVDWISTDRPRPDSLNSLTTQELANGTLNFLLQPAGITSQEFYKDYWEQKALLIQHSSSKHRHRFDGLLSLQQIKDMLSQKEMCYGRDLNVTRYEMDSHGVKRRVTLDLVPSSAGLSSLKERAPKTDDQDDDDDNFVQADAQVVWNQYQQGATIRLLCPHNHSDPVHQALNLLELEWGSMVGANAYLTPPGSSQGFAPHYDDIEAFCLQLEGRKRWKVYAPLNKGETLPRQSSPDYTEDDLKDVEPVMDIILSPGDILYMPRGWIHQACTLADGQPKDSHSLHLTISAMQQWCWADLMEIVLPEACTAAAASETSTALREGLPVRFLDYMGAAYANRDVPKMLQRKDQDSSVDSKEARLQELQECFRNEAKARIMRVAKEAMDILDASCDQLSKQFISSRQPITLSKEEQKHTSNGQAKSLKIQPNALVRMVRPGVARLVLEDDKAIVYHCLDNSREYHGRPLSPLEFELDDGPALEQLLKTTEPQWICVEELFHDTIEDKVGVTQALFDEGMLMIRE